MGFSFKFTPNPRLRKRIRRAQRAGALAMVEVVLQEARRDAPRKTGELAGSASTPKLIRPWLARAAFRAPHAKPVEARTKWLNTAIRKARRRAKRAGAKAFRRAFARG